MRCMACGAEMILTNVVQDDTIGVPGFEHQTFRCSECHDLERRFVFTKQDRDGDGEPMPEQAAPSVAPASTVHEEHVAVAEIVSVESTQVAPLELTQTAPVKTICRSKRAKWNRRSRTTTLSLRCSRHRRPSCLHRQRRMSRLSLQVF